MTDIRLYRLFYEEGALQVELLSIVPDVATSYWTHYYNQVGTWEGHFSLHSPLASCLQDGGYYLITQGERQALITGRQEQGDELVLYGRSPQWLLTRRVLPPFRSAQIPSTIEEIVTWALAQTFDEADALVVEPSMGEPLTLETQRFWRIKAHPVAEVITDCLARDHAGWQVWFDFSDLQFHFRIYKGVTRSLLLSEHVGNAYGITYTEDAQEYATRGWYGKEISDRGNWDPVENDPPLKDKVADNFARCYYVEREGSQFGLAFEGGDYLICTDHSGAWQRMSRQERDELDSIWVRVERSDPGVGLFRWDAVLDAGEESSARSELETQTWEKALTADTVTVRCGVDYQLGDLVRIQQGSTRDVTRRIQGVSVWFEQNHCGERPLFKEDEE